MGWAVYIRGCSTYFKYARLRVFLLFWVKLVGEKWPFWAFHIAYSQANMLLFYLKSVQPKMFLSLWGNRRVIKLKTLFSHHFYVSMKLASEKGRHTHIPVSLEKTEDFSFPICHLGPFTQESTLTHSAMHWFMMWREIQGGRPSPQRNPCSQVLQVLPLFSARKNLTSGMSVMHICSMADLPWLSEPL